MRSIEEAKGAKRFFVPENIENEPALTFLNVNARIANVLDRENIVSIGDFRQHNERTISWMRGMGETSISQLVCALKERGVVEQVQPKPQRSDTLEKNGQYHEEPDVVKSVELVQFYVLRESNLDGVELEQFEGYMRLIQLLGQFAADVRERRQEAKQIVEQV